MKTDTNEIGGVAQMTEEQIKYMVDRFLGWRLPQDFRPDAGISFTRPSYHPSVDATPSGTNLFDAQQAEAMLRYLIEGLPSPQPAREAVGEWKCGRALRPKTCSTTASRI